MSSKASEYARTVGGRLQLKGGLSLKAEHKKRKKHAHHHHHHHSDQHAKDPAAADADSAAEEHALVKRRGSGRLLSSGTTVMGQPGTKFMLELSSGDAIIIQHPTTLQEETRIVKMVLSDVSLSISSAFSSDLVSSTPFEYIRAPKELEAEAATAQSTKKRKRAADEAAAFGTYAGGTEAGSKLTYRVKKGGAYGGYTLVTETADATRSREELLDLRAKKKGDRHCM